MAFVKRTSSQIDAVRPYLEGVAKNLVERIWGSNGPPWGTTLTEIETLVVELRKVVSEEMLQLALRRQAESAADQRPERFRNCPSCNGSTEATEPEPRLLETRGGEAEWQEPQAYCTRCRRAFFPSVQKPGDRPVRTEPGHPGEDRLCRDQ